jgi:hypothetical protein
MESLIVAALHAGCIFYWRETTTVLLITICIVFAEVPVGLLIDVSAESSDNVGFALRIDAHLQIAFMVDEPIIACKVVSRTWRACF